MTQKPPQIKPCRKLLVKPTLSSCLIALSLGPGATQGFLIKSLGQLCSLVYLCGHMFIDPPTILNAYLSVYTQSFRIT